MEKRLTKEEFLKDLWHPASEMPDKNRTCLVRVVYHPNHLVSTSLSKDAVSGKGNYAGKCLLEIEVPESTKILDVNGLLGARNKFDWQKEFLLPSNVGFEVLSRRGNGDRLLFRLRLLEQ